MKIMHVLRDEVGHIAVLGPVPHQFRRVEVRSVRRQPLDLKPIGVLSLQQSHRFAMGIVAVQYQDELAPQTLVHQGHKSHYLFKTPPNRFHLLCYTPVKSCRLYGNLP
jgi:hypothetical protein